MYKRLGQEQYRKIVGKKPPKTKVVHPKFYLHKKKNSPSKERNAKDYPPRTWCETCKEIVQPVTTKNKAMRGLMCWDCGRDITDAKNYPQVVSDKK